MAGQYGNYEKAIAEAVRDILQASTGIPVTGGSGGGGDASAANQLTEIARIEAVRDRLNPTTGISSDGDLRNIDTESEAYSADPTSNSSGAASGVLSIPYLLRWLVQLTRFGSRLKTLNGSTWESVLSGLSGTQSNTNGMLAAHPHARYNSSTITLTDGQARAFQLDSAANLKVNIATAIAAGENFVGAVGGKSLIIEGSFTRPADTTTYAANDVVSNSASGTTPIEFTNAARVSGGSGIILHATLTKNTTTTANATFRLWIYTTSPNSPPNDNAAFSPTWANRSNRIGYIDFDSAIVGSDCVDYHGVLVFTSQVFKASGNHLYGLLQVKGAYAPGLSEQFLIRLGVVQD